VLPACGINCKKDSNIVSSTCILSSILVDKASLSLYKISIFVILYSFIKLFTTSALVEVLIVGRGTFKDTVSILFVNHSTIVES